MGARATPEKDPTAGLDARRVVLWRGKWGPAHRIAVFLVGCFQQFYLTIFFRKQLLPHYEWWDLVEPGMYFLTEGVALAASLGLLLAALVTTPGRLMRTVLMTLLALGMLANASRITSGLYHEELWAPLVCDAQERGAACEIWLGLFINLVVFYLIFGALIYLNLTLFLRLRGARK